jgi:hypothetical protein
VSGHRDELRPVASPSFDLLALGIYHKIPLLPSSFIIININIITITAIINIAICCS